MWIKEQNPIATFGDIAVHLHALLYRQRPDSFSPSTGLDGVRFFSVWKEAWLAMSPNVAMGFCALIHINLTVTVLALTCLFKVNFFPPTYMLN
jgi:hypothetical protein